MLLTQVYLLDFFVKKNHLPAKKGAQYYLELVSYQNLVFLLSSPMKQWSKIPSWGGVEGWGEKAHDWIEKQ